jgi:hypothetical protein
MGMTGTPIPSHRHVHRPYLTRNTPECLEHTIVSVSACPIVADTISIRITNLHSLDGLLRNTRTTCIPVEREDSNALSQRFLSAMSGQ